MSGRGLKSTILNILDIILAGILVLANVLIYAFFRFNYRSAPGFGALSILALSLTLPIFSFIIIIGLRERSKKSRWSGAELLFYAFLHLGGIITSAISGTMLYKEFSYEFLDLISPPITLILRILIWVTMSIQITVLGILILIWADRKPNNNSFLSHKIFTKPNFKHIYSGCIAVIIILGGIASPISYGVYYKSTCNQFSGTFSLPAYTYPIDSHINPSLDNESSVNQTLFSQLEMALWSMTKLQRGGGFPMSSETDGSRMYSDRGDGCPLFPNEFSLQGGTAAVAGVYLDMYGLEPNPIYLEVATDAADALLAVQDEENGGFYYDGRRHDNGDGYQPHPKNTRRAAIFDDNVMQSSMSFLLDVYNVTGDEKYLNAVERGFDLIFSLEKQGGGWPQRSNYPDDQYQSRVTLNDDTMEDLVYLMLKANDMLGDPKYLVAAERAGGFLIRVQGNGGSIIQQAWAQQYDQDQPAWARAFEPPAFCSKQTGAAIKMLMELYLRTGNNSYLNPIPAAIDWLNSTDTLIELTEDPGRFGWSRLYELETNLPIVGNRNNQETGPTYYYDYIPERDFGYSWEGTYEINTTLEDYAQLEAFEFNRSAYSGWRFNETAHRSINDPGKYLSLLNAEGFWVSDGLIRDSIFATYCSRSIAYFADILKDE